MKRVWSCNKHSYESSSGFSSDQKEKSDQKEQVLEKEWIRKRKTEGLHNRPQNAAVAPGKWLESRFPFKNRFMLKETIK